MGSAQAASDFSPVLDQKIKPKRKTVDHHALSPFWSTFFHIVLGLSTLACVFPFIFTVVISLSDEQTLARDGYSIFPAKWSTLAYEYVFRQGQQLLTSYGVSMIVTVLGTLVSLIGMAFFAYAISRPEFSYRKQFSFLAFFPTLLNAGIVPLYIVVTQFLHMKDTIWSLILPLAVNPFNIFLLRAYFQTSVPDGLIEAARIDGAGEFKVFWKIVAPISLPIFATVILFTSLAYWNDWFNAMLYIDNPKLIPAQFLLVKIQNNVQFLAQNRSALGSGVVESLKDLPAETMRMALVVLVAVPVVCVFPFFQKYFIRGLTGGAIKE